MAAAATDEDVLRNSLPAVEHALGYRFRDRRLLLTALTHRSFCNETDTASGDFDELEWLGDAVLQLAVSSWLFRSAKGSRRKSGQLSTTRQRFVSAGACESFARQLNLVRRSETPRLHSTSNTARPIVFLVTQQQLPFLRIGNAQPVQGTKILADCFEAVLGAVYVDAGGCSDLEPIHAILARAIPSYEHGNRSQEQHQRWHRHHLHHQQQFQQSHLPGAQGALEPPKPRAEEPRKLMNLAHRLAQMAKRGAEGTQSGGARPLQGSSSSLVSHPAEGSQRNSHEVLREFDERLRGFQHNVLQGGALSFGSRAFAQAFGEDVARFFSAAATGDPERCALLDSVLAGSSNLRKHFGDAPPGSERVVMAVVPVPSEVRLQTFTVVEYLLAVVFQQGGGSAEQASDNPVLRLIRSASHGETTITCLSNIVTETGTCLLLNTRHRAVISGNQALSRDSVPPPDPSSSLLLPAPRPPHAASGGERPHPGFPSQPDHLCLPGRKRSPPPRGVVVPWGGAGQRGRGGGWGRGGGGGGGRGMRGGRGGGRLRDSL
ncbi:unnamed protein product [Pylaiella littoralis]